ncbi:hypothetical protein [Bacillus infantis]|uniref:hypothetical protein n=1 Tax=Bacillus infantis TaxID=324767 RepID=UPI003CF05321
MTKQFQIQVPTELIRNPKISHDTFYVYLKLIQHYYVRKAKEVVLDIDHKKFMFYSNIKSNQTFKKCINQLKEYGLVNTELDSLPKRGLIKIELNGDMLTSNKGFKFAQLPYYLMDKCILDTIGYEGIRLLYYLKSYINRYDQFCFCSRDTIAADIGSNPKTIDKYLLKLKKNKFIKIVKHQIEAIGEFIPNEFGNEKEGFSKYNNHYYIRADEFEKIHTKLSEI